MDRDESKDHLLGYKEISTENAFPPLHARVTCNRSALISLSFLLLSLLGNMLLLHENHKLKHRPDLGRSKFSGLGYDHPIVYQPHSDYSSNNDTLADSLWEALDTSPIIVALTDDYAHEHNLDISARFPWDDTKGIYHIKAFHHLHCLKNLRKAYSDFHRSNVPIISAEHVYHCLDTLRQDVTCLADDTPMPTVNALHQIGNGQVRQCRDLMKLVAWTQEPERHACYRMLDDYRRVPHSLEQFAYCAKDSRYFSVAEKYFKQHGHKDPYGD